MSESTQEHPSSDDQARSDHYALLARLWISPPNHGLLHGLAEAGSCVDPLGDRFAQAWNALSAAASAVDEFATRSEFDALFTGIGTPLLNPYASLYLSGYMMEKPLAELRDELGALGLKRKAAVCETEDHLAALCETMRLLIAGTAFTPARPIAVQQKFFDRHLGPWYARCTADVRTAGPANFYRVVADFTEAFLDLENETFELVRECSVDTATCE